MDSIFTYIRNTIERAKRVKRARRAKGAIHKSTFKNPFVSFVSFGSFGTSSLGFSLIELIVVLMILSILFVSLMLLFNPFAQIQKVQNANRQHDINQIKQALDSYFNDNGCYPASIPFGSAWTSGKTVYMQKVPQDPDCSEQGTTDCYDYQTDGSNCPQWNILYTTLHPPISSSTPTCSSTLAGCLPTTGLYTYNYCAVSGKLDCAYLSTNPLPTPTIAQNGGGGGSTPTPTPTIDPNGPLSGCSQKSCDVEAWNQCVQSGQGSINCYQDLVCGHPGNDGQGNSNSSDFCKTQ